MDPRSRDSLLRIIDVNLNRAAEALRAAEEVCRFHWKSRGFAADLKALRHEVLEAVSPVPGERAALIASRDIEGDVGRETPSPAGNPDAESMAFRNIERAKEALRALEEACSPLFPHTVGRLKNARYRLYAVEKGISRLVEPTEERTLHERLRRSRLCLIATPGLSRKALRETVILAVEAGVDMVQLREKTSTDQKILENARELRETTARLGALFIVNDRPDIALLSEADGVHLGQDDLSVADARRILGPHRLVGRSTHSLDQARAAEREGSDYIGSGPVFPTATKDAGPLLGLEGLRSVLEAVDRPTFAIGGVNPERAREIARAGGDRVAVSSAILCAGDPAEVVRQILTALVA